MSRFFSFGTVLLTSFAAFAPLAAHADTPQGFNTVCLWNDTGKDVAYELTWRGVQTVRGTMQRGLWKSHGLILQNANSHLVPVFVRYLAHAGSDVYTDWIQLTPQRTSTKTCTLLRNYYLHYSFNGDSTLEPGVALSGPTLRQQAVRP